MLGHFGQAGLQRERKKNPNYHKNAHTYGSLEHMLLLRLVFYVFMVKMNEKINFLYTEASALKSYIKFWEVFSRGLLE